MIKVSIILPSLNVVSYIEECIQSVINQNLKNIEIICVDAGSTDGTLEIIQEYAARDSRIRILKSEKRSYGYQMNLGIREAGGEYIGIVETDDYIPIDMYEALYKTAKEYDLDFVKSDFYRFMHNKDGSIYKQYNALIGLPDYQSIYGKVIEPIKEKVLFRFAVNTWCGIYKREFLLKNDIWHNETPGASFQDEGFWFQTTVYAKRAMYINCPFYMNRRDNPQSSVYSKDKVYAACDEYIYIKNCLKKHEQIWSAIKDIYVWKKFSVYFGNLERLGAPYSLEFLKRFSEEFHQARINGEVSENLFSEKQWNDLLIIEKDYQKYYLEVKKKTEEFYETIQAAKQVILYGAGTVGKRMYYDLTYKYNCDNIVCFAVTDTDTNEGKCCGIPVCSIETLLEYREDAHVVVAVGKKFRNEVEAVLKNLNFQNILQIPNK